MQQSAQRKWVLAAIAIVVLCPFPTTVVPARRILVVNEESKPIRGVIVRQIWQNYSIEFNSHEQDLVTNEQGRVLCPTRRVWTGLLPRVILPLLNLIGQGVHASFGVREDILILGNGNDAAIEAQPIEPLPGEKVYHIQTHSADQNQ